MTANLLTLTKEKRESSMNRDFMPATTLTTLKKIAFTLLCCVLLVLFAAPAGAQTTDQGICAGALNSDTHMLGNATGCGILITVTGVDGLGNATAIILTNTGNGNPYDGSEDSLVGIQNSSTGTLNSITLASSSGALFGFDTDGPCTLVSHSWCSTVGFTGYEGPNNTFTNISQNQMRGTVKFTAGIPSCSTSNNCSTWFALEGTPDSLVTVTPTQTAPPVPVTQGTATNADFSFSNTSGQIVDHKLGFPNDVPFPPGETTVNVLSNNVLLSDSRDWPPFVIGTPWGPSHLFVKNGDNQAVNGTDFGSMYEDACYVPPADPSTATEGQCPGFDPTDTDPTHVITAKDVFDPLNKPVITPGPASPACATDACTAALIHFYPTQNEAWSPSASAPNPVCIDALNGSPSSPPPDCDLANVMNFQLSGDQTTSGGGTHRKGAYVSVFNVPMLETQVSVNGVQVNTPGTQSNPRSVPFSPTGSVAFTVNPAGCLNAPNSPACPSLASMANNNFSPAPAALLNFTVKSGANTVISGTPTFATSGVQRQSVQNNTILSPGTYVIQWQALDSVGIVEQNIQLVPNLGSTCPDSTPDPNMLPCYVTSPFTATVTITPPPSADLALIKFGNLSVKTQTNITYTIGLVNLGPNTAYGVTITDPLPSGTSFVSAVFSTVSCTTNPGINCSTPIKGAPCSLNGSTVSCNIGTLPPWTKGNPNGAGVKLVVKGTAAAGGKITNKASVTAFNPDPHMGNNSFSWTTLVTK